MKTAISIPDQVFHQAEQYAKQAHKSRSRVFCEAISEYLARHTSETITETMNRVCQQLDEAGDEFTQTASERLLRQEKW